MALSRTTLFEDLTLSLLGDPDANVRVAGRTLFAGDQAFAVLDDEHDLIVLLPSRRAAGLLGRGAVAASEGPAAVGGRWLKVVDIEDWTELAAEAHQFVGEPAVGGQS